MLDRCSIILSSKLLYCLDGPYLTQDHFLFPTFSLQPFHLSDLFLRVWRKVKHSLSWKGLRIHLLKHTLKLLPKRGAFGRGFVNDNLRSMIFVSILLFRERNIRLFPSSKSVAITRTALLIRFQFFCNTSSAYSYRRIYTYLTIINAICAELSTDMTVFAIPTAHLLALDCQVVWLWIFSPRFAHLQSFDVLGKHFFKALTHFSCFWCVFNWYR